MARWGHFRYGQAHYDEVEKKPTVKGTHMYDLHKVLTNPFDDEHIGIERLLAFATDNLARMIANNPTGIFTARIAATGPVIDGAVAAYGDDQTKAAMRKAKTKMKEGFRVALPAAVGKIHGAVESKFGADSAEMTECFPGGRNAFTSVKDAGLEEQLQTLVNGVTAHQTDLGAQVVTDATALKTSWKAVYSDKEDSSATKISSMDAKNAARQALQLELYLNLLAIGQNFPRQPEKLDIYMQQSLLQPHTQTATAPAPATAPADTTQSK